VAWSPRPAAGPGQHGRPGRRLDRFALYVFDYGAPAGFRIATRHPERITRDHLPERFSEEQND